MQPLTDDIYAALKEAERKQVEEILFGTSYLNIPREPRRRTSILNDF